MTPDAELLATFARTNSEDAFAELVQRHVNLVYSAALRQVNGDEHFARDVAQTVFTDLARKAGSLARRESLTGWLYTSAHFAAAKIVRTETRRRDREETFMRELTNQSSAGVLPAAPSPDHEWEILRPLLDTAMHELKAADREAILLRYFENRQFAEVGARLGLNENAARMRVERALEKLRAILAQRGIVATATLASLISAHAVQLAPVGLAVTLTTASLVSVGTGTLTLLKIMAATQIKLTVTALVVAGAATAFVLQYQAQEKLRTDNAALTQQLAQLQTDNQNLSNQITAAGNAGKLTDDQFKELLKLRGEVGVLNRQVNDFKKSRQVQARKTENTSPILANAKSEAELAEAKERFNAEETIMINNFKQIDLAEHLFANRNQGQFPTNFIQLATSLESTNLTQFAKDKVELRVQIKRVSTNPQVFEQTTLLTEKLPRKDYDGKWRRIYCFADGSIHVASSDVMNFNEWERQSLELPIQTK